MTVLITLTTAGSDTGPFDLYSDVDGFVVHFENNVPKASLVSGYTSSLVPNGTIVIRVKSDSICTNYIDLIVGGGTTTTTTSTSTSTSTSTTTTTTTTTAAPTYEYRAYGYGQDTADTCGETGTWVLFGPPELTLYAFEPTAGAVTKFYNNPSPILGVWGGDGTPDGWRVKFARYPAVPSEVYAAVYTVATGAISGNNDCTP
jgi:hypothetical protein